jgi:PAS domain-containing protein
LKKSKPIPRLFSTRLRRAEGDLKAATAYAQNILDTVREPLLILDTTSRMRSANLAFYQTFQTSQEEIENRLIYELGDGRWDISILRTLFENQGIDSNSFVFRDFQVEHDFPAIGRRVILLSTRKLESADHEALLVLTMEDVTERRRVEEDTDQRYPRFFQNRSRQDGTLFGNLRPDRDDG